MILKKLCTYTMRGTMLGIFVFFISLPSYASNCTASTSIKSLSYEQANNDLRELGFIKITSTGKRSFNPKALSALSATEVGVFLKAIGQRTDPSAQFWLKLAGSTLQSTEQAGCFVRSYMLDDQKMLVDDLQRFSKLIKKMPQQTSLVLAMTNIAHEMDGQTTLAYLQAEQAVIYSGGMQGVGVNAANALHNRKQMQHLPNSLMKIMAKNLKDDDAALRGTIYQVEHMGY